MGGTAWATYRPNPHAELCCNYAGTRDVDIHPKKKMCVIVAVVVVVFVLLAAAAAAAAAGVDAGKKIVNGLCGSYAGKKIHDAECEFWLCGFCCFWSRVHAELCGARPCTMKSVVFPWENLPRMESEIWAPRTMYG